MSREAQNPDAQIGEDERMRRRTGVSKHVLRPISRSRWQRELDTIRYLTFGRAVPAVLFGYLGYLQILRLRSTLLALPTNRTLWASLGDFLGPPLPRLLYLLFCALPVVIYLTRPEPRARDGRLLPRLAAFTGTLILLVVGAFFNGPPYLFVPSQSLLVLSSLLATAALALSVWGLLYLRRNLSIIPEVRRLVTGGPYRLIRHPLYSAEILTSLAYVVATPARWAVLVFPGFVALQILRAHYEETLLRHSLPEYEVYARRTWRMIPLVW